MPRYSRSRSRERHRERDRGDRDRRRSPARNMPPPEPLLEEPEVYGCYRGRVTGSMQNGAFVELLGFRGKQEGLVSVANMAKTRHPLFFPVGDMTTLPDAEQWSDCVEF